MSAFTRFPSPAEEQHATFVNQLLPQIERHAAIFFRGIRCPEKKADRIAECVALAWKWYVRLCEVGKDVMQFPVTFTRLVARAVKCGRKAAGMLKSKDVLNELAQQRQGFLVERLPNSIATAHEELYAKPHGQKQQDTWEERLQGDRRWSPAEAAAFRIDWPEFLHGQTERDRRLAEFLALGNSNKETARCFRLSPGRVTQIRKRLCQEWFHAHGEKAPFEEREEQGRSERA